MSPLQWASETGRLSGALEEALADDPAVRAVTFCRYPKGNASRPTTTRTEMTHLPISGAISFGCAARWRWLKTMGGGYGDKGARPDSDWKSRRIGAEPPDVLATLRTDAAMSIYAACGVPPSLVTCRPTGQASAKRGGGFARIGKSHGARLAG